jgi:hypothetical protein
MIRGWWEGMRHRPEVATTSSLAIIPTLATAACLTLPDGSVAV